MNIEKREARFASVDLLLDSGYLWLARDLNGSIAAYSHKPFKLDDEVWRVEEGESKEMGMWVDDGDLYNFVKWEDDEPVNIREWFKKEEEEMKMYYVRNGELESEEVDADFFEKNTTLGGLLTPKEVELDQDNRKVAEGANTITTGTLNCPNMGLNPITDTIQFTNPTTSDKVELDQDNCGESTLNIIETEWFSDSSTYDANSMYPPCQLTLDEPIPNHAKVCQELTETYEKKNADYGNSFENSLDKHGLIAGIIRMDDKMSRLISLNSKNEQQVMDESLRDTLMDLANYVIMSVMWLDEQ